MNNDGAKITNEMEAMIRKHWGTEYGIYYFAQVLSGECNLDETLKDLMGLEDKP